MTLTRTRTYVIVYIASRLAQQSVSLIDPLVVPYIAIGIKLILPYFRCPGVAGAPQKPGMAVTIILAALAILTYRLLRSPTHQYLEGRDAGLPFSNTMSTTGRPKTINATAAILDSDILRTSSSSFVTRLPPELRNRIYRLILVANEPINIVESEIKYYTALLKTCRQLRSEASQIFFAENRFCAAFAVDAKVTAVDWLSSIGRKQAGQITALSIVPQTAKDVKKAVQHRQAWQVAVETAGEAMVCGIIASGVNIRHIRLTPPVLDSAHLNWTVSVAFMFEMLKLQLQYEMERMP